MKIAEAAIAGMVGIALLGIAGCFASDLIDWTAAVGIAAAGTAAMWGLLQC